MKNKKIEGIITQERKFPFPPKQTQELKEFNEDIKKIAQITALYPCKKDKLYEEFKQKGAHLIKDENLPDIGKQFNKDYDKRY